MQGKLAQQHPSGCGEYSELKVLRSGAGYYIGTEHHHELGFTEPGSRESEEYYASEKEAQDALDNESWTQRDHP